MPKLIALLSLAMLVVCDIRQVAAGDISVRARLKHDDALDGSVQAVAFSPDGAILASAYNVVVGKSPVITKRRGQGGEVKGQVVLWDVARKTRTETIECGGAVQFVTFSPDGKLLAAAFSDVMGNQKVRIRDVASRKDRHVLSLAEKKGLSRSVTSFTFSPDGKSLLVGTVGAPNIGEIIVFDSQTGKEKITLQGGETTIKALSFSSDGKLMVSISEDSVQVWDMTSLKMRNSFLVGRGSGAALSPDGETIAVSTVGSRNYSGLVSFTLREARTGKERIDFKCLTHGREISFTPDGKQLVYAYGLGILVVFDVATGKRIATVDGPLCSSLAIAGNGSLIATGHESGTVWLWDIGGGK